MLPSRPLLLVAWLNAPFNSIVSPRLECCLTPQALEKAMYSAKMAVTSAALSVWAFSAGAVSIDPTAAMASVGRTATVCGLVASADYMVGTRANPTFLTVVSPDRPDPKGTLNRRDLRA